MVWAYFAAVSLLLLLARCNHNRSVMFSSPFSLLCFALSALLLSPLPLATCDIHCLTIYARLSCLLCLFSPTSSWATCRKRCSRGRRLPITIAETSLWVAGGAARILLLGPSGKGHGREAEVLELVFDGIADNIADGGTYVLRRIESVGIFPV